MDITWLIAHASACQAHKFGHTEALMNIIRQHEGLPTASPLEFIIPLK